MARFLKIIYNVKVVFQKEFFTDNGGGEVDFHTSYCSL